MDRNLVVILAARACMSTSRAAAGVVTALYLEALGFSALELGLLFLGVAVASAVMSVLIGLVSDAVGRKVFLVLVPLLAAVAGGVYAFDRTTALLFVFAALGSFGRGAGAGAGNVGPYQPAESAFVAEGVPGWARTDAFGRLAFVSSIGALVGGLLAALAHSARAGGAAATAAYRPAFLAAAAFAAVAGLLALAVTEPERPARTGTGRRLFVFPRRSWNVLWRFWITNGVNGMAIGLFGPFVSYWFHRRFGATPGQIGVLFAVINAATLASALAAAPLGRRLGTIRAIVVVRALQGLLLVPLALAPGFLAAGAIYLVRMVVQRLGLPLRQSFTQMVADPSERAAMASLSTLPAQGTQAGSQVLAGYLFDEVALWSPLVVAGIVQTLDAFAYGALFGKLGRAQKSPATPQPAD
jgi:MFS family permease